MGITIYHNPRCETSRNVLALIRNSGQEPRVVEYLRVPPTREELADLIRRMGVPVRAVLRRKGTPYDELGLDDPLLTDDQLLDAMVRHPILIERPIVVSPLGVRLCRPSESVLNILPDEQDGPFRKESGEPVIDDLGRRVDGPNAP
jgi:arsenate reductase (glutaredoxin)